MTHITKQLWTKFCRVQCQMIHHGVLIVVASPGICDLLFGRYVAVQVASCQARVLPVIMLPMLDLENCLHIKSIPPLLFKFGTLNCSNMQWKCVRRIFALPYNTHCNLLPNIAQNTSLDFKLQQRFCKFNQNAYASNNKCIKLCVNLVELERESLGRTR